jgi:hypothetical protein
VRIRPIRRDGEGRRASRSALDEGGRYPGIPEIGVSSRLNECPGNRVRYTPSRGRIMRSCQEVWCSLTTCRTGRVKVPTMGGFSFAHLA